jgi:hypothetical protein
VARGIEFDWDDENRKLLSAHKVAPAEFEQLIGNEPLDLAYEVIGNEERYRSVRDGKVRAITAFPASVSDRKAFLEKPK